MNTRKITSRGFTIIETLVAIAILMISITGPLVIAQKALFAAYYARDQVIASFLAQDALEFIKNRRDNNLHTSGGSWYDGFANSCFSNGTVCSVDTRVDDGDIGPCSGDSCALYHDGTGFGPSNGSANQVKSYFSRSFRFEHDDASGGPASDCQTTHNKCTLSVRVWWKAANVSREVVNEVLIENEMFDVGR